MPNPFIRLIMLLAANDTKKTTGSLQTIFNEVTLLKINIEKKIVYRIFISFILNFGFCSKKKEEGKVRYIVSTKSI